MRPIDWRIVLIELFTAQGTPVFSPKTITVTCLQPRVHQAPMPTLATVNLCESTSYNPVDPDRETFSDFAPKQRWLIEPSTVRFDSVRLGSIESNKGFPFDRSSRKSLLCFWYEFH